MVVLLCYLCFCFACEFVSGILMVKLVWFGLVRFCWIMLFSCWGFVDVFVVLVFVVCCLMLFLSCRF